MTKFKKFFSQMAVILAATTAYPTISAELPAPTPMVPVIETVELTTIPVNVQEQVKMILANEAQKQLATGLLAMTDKEEQEAETTPRAE